MFGFGKPKKGFKKICQDPNAVYDLLYADRAKTSEILGDNEFINAWLGSKVQQEITIIISKEASSGDVPSLKQMVWYLMHLYEEISSAKMDEREKLDAIIGILEERTSFCNQLTSKGIPNHYYAMISLHCLYRDLYKELRKANNPEILEKVRDTLDEMVEQAQAVIAMGKDHPMFNGDAGIIEDTEVILREGEGKRVEVDVLLKMAQKN